MSLKGRQIVTMTPDERRELQEELASLVPSWSYWEYAPARVTWTNPIGVWHIEIDWSRGTMTTSVGRNSWVSTTWDMEWKRIWLAHHGAFE